MRKTFMRVFLAGLYLLGAAGVRAQTGMLSVSYTTSEKSKDSRTSSEIFSLNGSTLNYTVKYSGRKGPNQKDTVIKCTLSSADVEAVHAKISEKKLAVTDSLTLESIKDAGIILSAAIHFNYIQGRSRGKIRMKGDPRLLQQRPLYNNLLSLVNQLRGLLKKCTG